MNIDLIAAKPPAWDGPGSVLEGETVLEAGTGGVLLSGNVQESGTTMKT